MNKIQLLKRLFVLAVMVLWGGVSLFAQSSITITGTITDGKAPLIGVTVMVKGTQTGAASDAKGAYKINVPNAKSTLVISYIGYATQEIVVGNQKVINVALSEDTNVLDELVVVGYGVQKKSHLTGAVAKIDGSSLIDMPVSDVTQALQGKITGLNINNTTSEVGVAPEIRVRGIGSISANSSPLVVVDGYPVPDGLSMVNSADIQSIEVLKDAASSAIYGSRAANGVIMITTKSGSVGKPKYAVKFYSGLKYAYQLHDLINSQEYLDLMTWQQSVGSTNVPSGQIRAAAWLEDNLGYTNWQKQGLHDLANITNVQVTVSGGKKDLKYFTSASYTDDEGIMLQNASQKVNFRTKMDAQLGKFVDFGINISGTYIKGTRPVNNFIDFYRTPSFLPLYHTERSLGILGLNRPIGSYAHGMDFNNVMTPTGPISESDPFGNPTFEKSSPFSSNNYNPRSIMDNTQRGSESFQSVGNMYLNINITKDLIFRTSNGYNVKFAPSYSYKNKNATKDGEASIATYNSALYVDLLTENTLTYLKKINKHDFNILAGYTLEKTRNDRVALEGTGFPTDNIKTLNAATVFNLASSGNGNNKGTGTFQDPDKVLESFLARATYSYADKYLFSASLRLDRSSLFDAAGRNAWFPSVSVGWRISEEPFMKPISWISTLKLRGSYGVTGNNDISYNAALNTMTGANYPLGSGNGVLVPGSAIGGSTLSNRNITWEQTDEFNLGLDAGFLDNSLNVSLETYYSTTRALLFKQPAQSFTGFTSYWNNIGKVRNMGIELTIDSYNFRRKDFTWSTSANIAMNRNRFLEVGGEAQIVKLGERNENYLARVGSSVIQYYGFKTIGIWNSAEEIAANPHFLTGVDAPGGIRVMDVDKNGYIDDNDRTTLGTPYPFCTWGITNTFRYKNFDLSFLIQGVQGVTVLNGDGYYNESHKWNKNYINDRWVSPEQPGDGKTPYAKTGVDIMLTDYLLENASYLALRNATIGYSFSDKIVKKLHISGLRIYASGNNLLYLWSNDYKGINPESRMTTGDYADPLIAGYQRGGFPMTSTITFGIDINF